MSLEVAGTAEAKAEGPLKLAVPRGALLGGTLDALDAAGVDTAAVRGESRALIFPGEEITLVTMRPSDVPTYVESGAADAGITGKDVLLEQSDRMVYELLDLGYGRCRMVLAGRKGDKRLGESQRRLGLMRIATKYPRIAERHFESNGRQVETIEVKGSSRAGAADRPRRRHRRPRGDRPHAGGERSRGARGDRRVHGPVRRQSGRPQAAGGGDRRVDGAAAGGDLGMRVEAIEWEVAAGRRLARFAVWSPARRSRRPRSSRFGNSGAARAMRAVLELTARFDATEQRPGFAASRADRCVGGALASLDPALREALEWRSRTSAAVADAQIDEEPDSRLSAAGPDRRQCARCLSAAAGHIRPGRSGGLSVERADGRDTGPGRRRRAPCAGLAARARMGCAAVGPRSRRALRGRRGLRDGWGAGDLRACQGTESRGP